MSTPPSALAPFAHRAFLVLWGATLVANIGTWMRDVGLSWRMTELAGSATLVAAVQAASALPVLLLALPAGALADVVDRRRLLFGAQACLAVLSVFLVAMELGGFTTPGLILGAAVLGGIGAALSAPAWQAIVPQLVPREVLRPAVALNSMGVNIARAIGPALGGLLLATVGAWAVFALDALSFVGVLLALAWWRSSTAPRRAPPETIGGALRAGLRYARASDSLRRVLLRALGFFLFASAPWALLPLVARQLPGGGPHIYGLMLAAIGAGAVAGALLLPWLRRRLGGGAGRAVLSGTIGAGVAGLLLAAAPSGAVAVAACALLGLAWITVLTTLNVAAQGALPDWVRARGLAIYLATFSGAMMTGSLGWGLVADRAGLVVALGAAAAGGLTVGLLLRRVRLPEGDLAMVPSDHMPGHHDLILPLPQAGPVLVLVEYRLRQKEDRAPLLAALGRLGAARRRDGAEDWLLLDDPLDALRIVELFRLRDWAEHERMHDRATSADRPLHEAANALDRDGAPRIRHLVGAT
ncbi:MFS transporter [Falsiroseomonas sp. E2-1-a20]|uniref:MFS transporter n=1 Tax=Falsiroseomonas sp. E2-1-a20 TaxID=3239300 RepID=UPI003F2E37D2